MDTHLKPRQSSKIRWVSIKDLLRLFFSGSLGQFLQQRLRVLQVRGVGTFGEPVVDRGEHGAGLGRLALVLP